MAINPLNLPDPIRQSQIDWSPLNSIGEAYSQSKNREKIRSAIGSATDPTGNIDLGRAATNLANLGMIDEARSLINTSIAQGTLGFHQGQLGLARQKFEEEQRATRAGEEAGRRLLGGSYGPQSSVEGTAPASWYSQLPEKGWRDYQDRPGSNALGVPDSQQGIALPSRATLGQWFDVTGPDGKTLRLQQTDVGPARWTGKGVDISAAAADQFGYTPRTFPTGAPFSWKPASGPPVTAATPIGTRVASLAELPPSGDLTQPAPQQPLQQTAQAQPLQPQNARDARIQWLQNGLAQPNIPEGVRKVAQSQLDRLLKEKEAEMAPERKAAEIRASEMAKAEVKGQVNAAKDQKQAQSVTDTLDEFISLAKEIRNDKELYRSTGSIGKLYSRPGGAASQLDAKIETLKAQAAVNALQAMRDSSKTGGAVGQVAMGEYPILASKFGPISYPTSFDSAGYKKVLDAAIAQAEKAKSRVSGSLGAQGPKNIPDRVRQNGYVYEKQPDGSYKAVE